MIYEDTPVAYYDVECLTEGCENNGSVIRVLAALDSPVIYCGPCGAQLDATCPVEAAEEEA